ncbi:MAG: ferritin family protein [Candidatus Electryonea clarkiae]|nr:ferritin family protein [Candidatus Electryonea clarkiae]MDP8287482.1 ferritin family protein [Candidatus Electryonea clarkiae]
MSDKIKRVLNGLMEAVKAETDGQHFYIMAASNTNDEKGIEVFRMLAREEAEHVKYLLAQYKAVAADGRPDQKLRLPKPSALSDSSPIFSDNLKSRVKEAHMEMSALSIGIQLELNAIRFYKEQSEESDDPFLKDFYNELMAWEQGHYNALLTQQELLKEDYWSSSGFSPY